MTTPTKPRRRWFQFSLRTMFVLVTLFCIYLALWVANLEDLLFFYKTVIYR